VEAKTDKIYYKHHAQVNDHPRESVLNDNVVMSACRLARDTHAKAIIGITTSGYTAVRLSHHRPKASLFVFSPDARLRNVLGLYWGVQVIPYDTNTDQTADEAVTMIKQTLIERGELVQGDIFVNTLSMPLAMQRKTNTVKLSVVE
jgi:pyruvate kinase